MLRLSDVLQALPLVHELLAANYHSVGIVDDLVTNGICQNRSGWSFRLVRDIKIEYKIVEFRLYRDSTILY